MERDDAPDAPIDLPSDQPADDPIREQLLDATARVFASKGYHGTKIMDIVNAAGLSAGAVYGRFASKDELLMEAIIGQIQSNAVARRFEGRSVAEAIVAATQTEGPLDDTEAMQIEAYLAARREPQLAAAITEGRERWLRSTIQPLVQRAIEDGSASPNADFDTIVYFFETLHLGLLVQRGAGQHPPDKSAWTRFMTRLTGASAPEGPEARKGKSPARRS